MKGLKFIAVGAVLFLAMGLWAQTHHHGSSGHEHHEAMGAQAADAPMAAQHEAMEVLIARLDEKIEAMNAAKGDHRVEAMAEAVRELAVQFKGMRLMLNMRTHVGASEKVESGDHSGHH